MLRAIPRPAMGTRYTLDLGPALRPQNGMRATGSASDLLPDPVSRLSSPVVIPVVPGTGLDFRISVNSQFLPFI